MRPAGYGIYRAQWAMWAIAFALPCLVRAAALNDDD